MLITTAALPPKKEAPRRSGRTDRGTTNYINSSTYKDSTTAARVQRLTALCGVAGRRAELIAFLIWGEASNAE